MQEEVEHRTITLAANAKNPQAGASGNFAGSADGIAANGDDNRPIYDHQTACRIAGDDERFGLHDRGSSVRPKRLLRI